MQPWIRCEEGGRIDVPGGELNLPAKTTGAVVNPPAMDGLDGHYQTGADPVDLRQRRFTGNRGSMAYVESL